MKQSVHHAFSRSRDVRTSDAKFFRNGIITSINNEMTYIDFSTGSRKDLGIKSSWLCGVEEDG